jgi:tRNA(fMet)-specific endonuclease VapC
MSLFVLDTDILSLYYEGHATVCQRVHLHQPNELTITVMSVEEQLSGWYTLLRQAKKQDQVVHAYQRLIDTVRFLARWPILPYNDPAIVRYEQLKAMKLNIRGTDLRIAAITLEGGGILVSRNLRDFQRVPNLVVEDWSV